MDCCACKDAGDRGSAASLGHGGRAQDTAATGLRAEAASTMGGSRLDWGTALVVAAVQGLVELRAWELKAQWQRGQGTGRAQGTGAGSR